LTEASPICHSTGPDALVETEERQPRICRGARNFQVQIFARLGMIAAPTDAAWNARCEELGL
jgi:hypothetical protein